MTLEDHVILACLCSPELDGPSVISATIWVLVPIEPSHLFIMTSASAASSFNFTLRNYGHLAQLPMSLFSALADGMMSKSKISTGSPRVVQALGI